MSVSHSRDRYAGFNEIYQTEVLQSRRDRSRRAFFWAKLLSLALMLTIGATLRSEPELRRALANAGMDAVMAMASGQQSVAGSAIADRDSGLPKSQIKVNRFGANTASPDQTIDAQVLAQELGRAMAAQGVKN